MSISAPINQAARARALKRQHPYLSPADIAGLTGWPLANVKAALKAKGRDTPKSRRPIKL